MYHKDSYSFTETLKGGTPVTVRTARADDGPRIRQAFANLERETIYTRFFGYKSSVTDKELERVTHADFLHDVALVVTIGTGEEERVIGGASYAADRASSPPSSAEIAFTVEEDYQNRGVAGLLMRHIVSIARQNNLKLLTADVLSSNLAMLAVFRRSGLPMETKQQAGVCHLTLDLRHGDGHSPAHPG